MFRFTAPVLKRLRPHGERVLIDRTAAAHQTKAGVLSPKLIAGNIGAAVADAAFTASMDSTPTDKVGDTVLPELPEFDGSVVFEGAESLFDGDSLLDALGSLFEFE